MCVKGLPGTWKSVQYTGSERKQLAQGPAVMQTKTGVRMTLRVLGGEDQE